MREKGGVMEDIVNPRYLLVKFMINGSRVDFFVHPSIHWISIDDTLLLPLIVSNLSKSAYS